MSKEKFLKGIMIANIILLGVMFPLMIIMFVLTLGSLHEENSGSLFMQSLGYIAAFLFGLLALKRKSFFILSLIGWTLFFVGYKIDRGYATKGNNEACVKLRQDKNCVEDSEGTMDCRSGPNAGIIPRICENLK